MKLAKSVTALLLTVAVNMPIHAGVLSGSVKSIGGKPLEGVMVRLTDDQSGMSESVYTDANGNYTLATQLAGDLQLRLRTPYYSDLSEPLSLKADARLQKNLKMKSMTDAMEISDSLPAAYHYGNLPFEEGADANFSRLEFQRDCLSCHQLGNQFTRVKRTPESWAQTIARMHLYLGNFDMELRDERAVILSEGFTGEPSTVRPRFPLDPALGHAKVTEYRLEKGGVPHDAIYNPEDGMLYTVDQSLDHMAITDMTTGQTEYVLQEGGAAMSYESGMDGGANVIGEFNPGARHGPHSLDRGLDGKYYVTNTGTRSIGVFNPKTRQWEASHLMDEETKAVYPHTIRVDGKGIVWFTLTGSEQVGRLDPETGVFDIINLPTHKPMGIAGTTQPYGIDINPIDGSIWYGRLFADKIGRIDPANLQVVEYESPVSGPRRMHFDKQGVLWITGYSTGQLGRIDVSETLNEAQGNITSKVYTMPEFAEGFRPAPYALGIHPDSQDIWINENMTDRIYRFIPAQERFIVYPVPLRGTYTRDMTFTAKGEVCTSNNPLPAPALEGGVLQIICINPDYQPEEAARLALAGK
jgi:streptogramin lyase